MREDQAVRRVALGVDFFHPDMSVPFLACRQKVYLAVKILLELLATSNLRKP